MSLEGAIKSFFNNYFNFSGRARRSEYWYSFLFVFLLGMISGMVDNILFGHSDNNIMLARGLVYLATFIPMLAVSVRRLHDTGKSGWFMLLCLIPFVGAVMLIVFFIFDGDAHSNQWGESPKEVTIPNNPAY